MLFWYIKVKAGVDKILCVNLDVKCDVAGWRNRFHPGVAD